MLTGDTNLGSSESMMDNKIKTQALPMLREAFPFWIAKFLY